MPTRASVFNKISSPLNLHLFCHWGRKTYAYIYLYVWLWTAIFLFFLIFFELQGILHLRTIYNPYHFFIPIHKMWFRQDRSLGKRKQHEWERLAKHLLKKFYEHNRPKERNKNFSQSLTRANNTTKASRNQTPGQNQHSAYKLLTLNTNAGMTNHKNFTSKHLPTSTKYQHELETAPIIYHINFQTRLEHQSIHLHLKLVFFRHR